MINFSAIAAALRQIAGALETSAGDSASPDEAALTRQWAQAGDGWEKMGQALTGAAPPATVDSGAGEGAGTSEKIAPTQPADVAVMRSLLERAQDAIMMLDGVDAAAEKLVDDYRAWAATAGVEVRS